MIRPNGAPTITPGMGYAAGARGVGYAAHMGYAAGARGMGDISLTTQQAALEDTPSGITQADLDLLGSLGATDSDILGVLNGQMTLTQLYANYGVIIGSPVSASTPAPAATSTPAQVPSGSTLLYQMSFQSVNVQGADVIAALNAQLAAWHMSVIGSQVTSTSVLGTSPTSIQATILDSVGNAQLSDAKSVLDSIASHAAGGMLSSNLSIVSPGASAATNTTAAAATPQSAVTWLENNLAYIGIGIAALVLVNNFTGKRR